jgi:ADP-ribose pyrophosphatase
LKHVNVLERDGWEYVERKSAKEAVAVIAVTDDGKIILTEQYRPPVDARVIDWVAGLVEKDSPEVTARKELEEEVGYTCESVELIAKGPTSPGITSELVSFYRARSLKKTGDGGGIDNEKITVHVVPLDGIRAWLEKQDALIDLKVWSGLYFVNTILPK